MKTNLPLYTIVLLLIAAIVTILVLVFTNEGREPPPTPTPGPTATATSTSTPTATATPTPEPTPTATSVPFETRLTKLCAQDADVDVDSHIQYYESFADRYPGVSAISFPDKVLGQDIDFCLGPSAQTLISTQSSLHPNRPTLVTFNVPLEKKQPVERIWVLITASYTDREYQDENNKKQVGIVRVTFQNNGTYEKLFPLHLERELADWKVNSNMANVFDENLAQQQLHEDITRQQVRLLAVPLSLDPANIDPVIAVSIEDMSRDTVRAPDPALDIIAVTLVGFEHPPALPSTPPDPSATMVASYLCLDAYVDESIHTRQPAARNIIKQQDNVDFSFSANNCQDPTPLTRQVAEPLDVVLPANGLIIETHPEATNGDAATTSAPSKIVLNISKEQEARTASRIHLVMSARNLCLPRNVPGASARGDWYGETIGYINVYFKDGYALEKLPLKVGKTIRQGRPRTTCANDNVLNLDDNVQTQPPNMQVSQGIQVGANAEDEQFGIWLDVVTVKIPPQLQRQPIDRIEIVDHTVEGRNGKNFNDPYISLFAVTLMSNP